MSFKDYISNEIINRLRERIGQTFYSDEIGFLLTEYENANCSFFNSKEKAKDFIKEYFDEFLDFIEYYNNIFGDKLEIDSDNIENIQNIMMIISIESLYNQAVPEKYFDSKNIYIDKNFISEIKENLKTIKEVF